MVGLLEDAVKTGGVLGLVSGGKSTREVKEGRVCAMVRCEEGGGKES